jgi:gas vesicle protein
VIVIGEPNQGKSQLVNALVNASVCAVGDDLTTITPTIVQHAETPSAALVKPVPSAGPGRLPAIDPVPERVPVPVEEITGRAGRDASVAAAEVGLPRELLAAGLVLVDTPPANTASMATALSKADTVLMASDAATELSEKELDQLVQVAESCPNLVVVMTKIDLAPGWRGVAERNRERLAHAKVAARIVAVSAELRLRAAKTNDKKLNAESGFPDLISLVRQDLSGKSDRLAGQSAAVSACSAIAELVVRLREDLVTDATSGLDPDSNEVQRRIEALRRRTARWQTVLADEMAELVSDIEYDLRERTRKILREVDKAFDAADPAQAWDEFGDWLEDQMVDAAETNYAWLVDRCWWVAGKVAKTFPPRRGGVMPETLACNDIGESIGDPERPRIDRYTIGQKVFTALRGSYGGVLMFGLVTTLAGLPLINPFSVTAGVALGAKSIKDEADARLKQRQAAAKTAAQRYVDDFFLKFSKESKDAARQVQRHLRDHFTNLAEQLQDDVVQAAVTARQAAKDEAAVRERHNREISSEIARLAALHKRAQELARAALPKATAREITA